MTQPKIDRRTLLRGAGTLMALPFMEAMLPLSAMASSVPDSKKAVRLAFLFVPNGINMEHWTPAAEGKDFVLPKTMAPLKSVRGSINVLTGLTQKNAFALGDGGGDHARSAAAWLTGCHPRKTSGADIKAGISADQLAAARVGDRTRFASIELGCERGGLAGNCDSGYSCAYSNSVSWRGEANPVAKETDPRLVFERLFGGDDAGETAEARAVRRQYNRSILDVVMEDAKTLSSQLGTHDKQKLDEYFTSVREIERRIAFLEKAGQDGTTTAIKTNLPVAGMPKNYAEQIRLLGDMMVLAFQTDLTRISTFMFANEGSNRPYPLINIGDGHHDLSHHGKDPMKLERIQQINQFHVEQLAYILNKMQSIKEGDASLLDNTMLVYGGGISDGDRHNHDDLPLILAGKGGGSIQTGQHLRFQNGTPMTNLLLCLLDRMGVHAETLGDSSGRLQQLV